MKIKIIFLALYFWILSGGYIAVFAFEAQEYSTEKFTQEYIISNIPEFVKTPDGGVPWDVFAKTGSEEYDITDEEGMSWMGIKPIFKEDLKALDGKKILIQGYMFPLEQGEKQSRFLFGPFPLSCPFHYHVTPNLIIEAFAEDKIPFSYDPIDIRGTLELVPSDFERNIFYKIKSAKVVN